MVMRGLRGGGVCCYVVERGRVFSRGDGKVSSLGVWRCFLGSISENKGALFELCFWRFLIFFVAVFEAFFQLFLFYFCGKLEEV